MPTPMTAPPAMPRASQPALLKQTFKLGRSLVAPDGRLIDALTIQEMTQQQLIAAERQHPGSESAQTLHMLASASGEPAETLRRLGIPDVLRVQTWLRRIMADAQELDLPTDLAEESRRFVLCVPIQTEAAPITEVTVRTPDLAASITAEKFSRNSTEAERTAATVAELAGMTIPLVSRMTRRDVARIEAWLAPFVTGFGSLTDEAGGT